MSKLFHIVARLNPRHTLGGLTWAGIRRDRPFLSGKMQELRRYRRSRTFSNLQGAFGLMAGILLAGILAGFIPEGFTQKWTPLLMWISLPGESAYSLITDMLAAASSLVALSFVVTGFLIDKVEQKTQQGYDLIFHAAGLYFIFAMVMSGVASLVVINVIKHSVVLNTAANFAVLSAVILLMIIVAEIFLFSRVIALFSPKWKPRPLRMIEDANWYLFKTYDTLVAELNPVMTRFSLSAQHKVWKTWLRVTLILIIVLLSFFELDRLFTLNSTTL